MLQNTKDSTQSSYIKLIVLITYAMGHKYVGYRFSPPMCVPRWDTADAEIKLPPSGSKGLCERFPVCKPTVGQSVVLHARPAFLA